MNLINNEIENYLDQSFRLKTDVKPVTQAELDRLPLYLKSGYHLFSGQITTVPIIWAQPAETFTPEQLGQHQYQLEQIFHCLFFSY